MVVLTNSINRKKRKFKSVEESIEFLEKAEHPELWL